LSPWIGHPFKSKLEAQLTPEFNPFIPPQDSTIYREEHIYNLYKTKKKEEKS